MFHGLDGVQGIGTPQKIGWFGSMFSPFPKGHFQVPLFHLSFPPHMMRRMYSIRIFIPNIFFVGLDFVGNVFPAVPWSIWVLVTWGCSFTLTHLYKKRICQSSNWCEMNLPRIKILQKLCYQKFTKPPYKWRLNLYVNLWCPL